MKPLGVTDREYAAGILLAAFKSREQKMKAKAKADPARSELSRRAVRFDLEELRKAYQPKFDRARQIR